MAAPAAPQFPPSGPRQHQAAPGGRRLGCYGLAGVPQACYDEAVDQTYQLLAPDVNAAAGVRNIYWRGTAPPGTIKEALPIAGVVTSRQGKRTPRADNGRRYPV